uniref:Ig-like domain-containing protein n=1 Tax=Labrus bergylta TaxID=56723 RepID=A0A3Q3NIS2_9LABR
MISESSDSLLDYPVVVDSLEDICAEENGKASFTTTIKYTTRVNWFFNGQLVKSGKEFKCSEDLDKYTLIIEKVVKEKHQGEYVCEASNQHGSDECSASLSVTGKNKSFSFLSGITLLLVAGLQLCPPAFITKPEQQTMYVGKRAMIQCVITGSVPLNVVWLKNNQTLPTVPTHYQIHCEKNKHTLEIIKLEPDDRGLYVCKVSNNVGTAECSMELRVITQPNFVKPLGPVAAVVGAPLHLECQVDEDTGVNVTWTRDGRKVHQSPDCKLSFEDKTVSLDILKTTLKDCGNYVCTVTNEAGSASYLGTSVTEPNIQSEKVFSNKAICPPLEPPSFRKELLPIEAVRGSVAVLECEISGSAPFEVAWKKNKKRLSPDNKYSIVSQGALSSLEIRSFESADTGEYECVVSNEVGSVTSKSVAKQRG